MALTTTLAFSVGPAIAKGILKVWLKDKDFLASVGESIVDLLSSKTSDEFTKKKAERQFQEIGDRVAQSLLPMFESDGSNLDEGGKTSVALAVAETLEMTPLTAAFLLDRKLDPVSLASHLLNSRPNATVGFSETETELYRRIMAETSRYIVDVASQLPAFTEKSFAELIKRGDQLLDTTTRILEEVTRIRSGIDQPEQNKDSGRFEADYRLAVGRRLDELELFGVDFASSINRRHRLSVAYVTLSVRPRPPASATTSKPSAPTELPEPDAPEDSDNILSVDIALKRSTRILIRGHAGSGKTTLLQWVAVKASARTFTEPLTEWNNFVPFFIRLRDCVEKGLPKPEEFPGLVAPSIAGLAPRGWVHEKLNSGKAVLLIDGVDEMREAQRSEVRAWIKDLSETFPDVRILVSSRPTAIAEGWMDAQGFEDAELQPMEFSDIQAFVEHWHSAVREQIHDDVEAQELELMQDHLKKVVRNTPAIRSLEAIS